MQCFSSESSIIMAKLQPTQWPSTRLRLPESKELSGICQEFLVSMSLKTVVYPAYGI